jgi:hypothetical protein
MKTQATYDGTSKSTQICPVSRFLCEINQNTLGITTQSKCHNKQVSPPAEVYQIYAYAAQNGELALFLVAAAACPTKTTAYARIFGLPELRRRSLCIGL